MAEAYVYMLHMILTRTLYCLSKVTVDMTISSANEMISLNDFSGFATFSSLPNHCVVVVLEATFPCVGDLVIMRVPSR